MFLYLTKCLFLATDNMSTTQARTYCLSFSNTKGRDNGTKDMIMGLPILKMSYYTQLQERKMNILKTLAMGTKSLNDISKELKLSLSLLSYHVHGNRKSEGLLDMHLAELSEKNNQSYLTLTSMGRLILRGLMPECETC